MFGFICAGLTAQLKAKLHPGAIRPHGICPSDLCPLNHHAQPHGSFLCPKNIFLPSALLLATSFSSLSSPLEHQLPREAFADPRLTSVHCALPQHLSYIQEPQPVALSSWCVTLWVVFPQVARVLYEARDHYCLAHQF